MIEPAALVPIPVRAEEAWQPVLLGGMIPFAGALAVFALIYKAVKANPENDPPPRDEEPAEPPEPPEDPADPPTPT
ncbi:MAG TPA: hypothetical protein VGG40_02335 [Solirubrobacterales bacterium]|jgi:hypothetical protein